MRDIFADLVVCGRHADGAGTFEVAVVTAPSLPSVSEARTAAEAQLARLQATTLHVSEVRRRYAADTACNAWTLEQAALDVMRAAHATAQAFARRAELA